MNVKDAIKGRRSIRKYSDKNIPNEILDEVLNSMRLAPSAKNMQPYKFIIIKDKELKENLVSACRGQKFISEAPVVICACVEPKESYSKMGGYYTSEYVDVSIAIDHMTLQAFELGLGTCWIGAFEESEVKKVLDIPQNIKVAALSPLGYPLSEGKFGGRKKKSELFYLNKYGREYNENNN